MVDNFVSETPPHLPTRVREPILKQLLHNGKVQSLIVAGFLGLSLMACTSHHAQQPPEPVPAVEPTHKDTRTDKLIEAGRAIRVQDDINMLDTTPLGIDLKYSDNSTVLKIRQIQNTRERILAAIGFLDVETRKRYNGDTYACNNYALDLVRLIIGNSDIGSRYNTFTGEPGVLGLNDTDWSSAQNIARIDKTNPYLHGNNLDWWMKQYGTTGHNWRKVTQHDLDLLMKTGNYIGLAVNDEDYLRTNGVQFGHVAVIVPDGGQSWGLSQATRNVSFRQPQIDDPIVGKPQQYNFYLHPISPALPTSTEP